MKPYLVISDIHGSSLAANKIKALVESNQFKAILCCGDILYHGPRNGVSEDYDPKAVIEVLNNLAIPLINVKGNCDGEVDSMVLNFPIDNTCNSLFINDRRVFMTHGHHLNPDSDLSFLTNEDIFLYGHVHLPFSYQNEQGIYILNPGSMTFPKQGHPKTYGILDNNGFTIYTLDDQKYQGIEFNNK